VGDICLSTSRVLVVAPQPFYEDRGTPIAVCQLLRALSELDYEVDVLTYPVGRPVEIPGVRLLRAANPFRVRRVPVGLSWAKLVLDATLVPAMARRLRRGGYRCIHAVEEAAFPAVVLGRRFGVPVIYDMQSSLPEQLGRHWFLRGAAAQSALRRSERWLLGRADSVVSSAGLAQRVRDAAPATPLAEWRYASPLPAAGPAEAERLRAELRLEAGQRIILYSGTFEDYQGLPALLEALPLIRRRVPEAALVLVGAPETPFLAERHAAMMRNGALRVVGRQPRERMPPFLALADVAVSPRAWGENLPLKVFDYLGAGKPIVATDIPAHRAALDESRALLCAPTAGALAEALARLLEDRVLATRLAAAARAYSEEQLAWSAFVRSVGELYRQVGVPRPAARVRRALSETSP
jgi:glycosyltransferase involved in cell wall biosynthesis